MGFDTSDASELRWPDDPVPAPSGSTAADREQSVFDESGSVLDSGTVRVAERDDRSPLPAGVTRRAGRRSLSTAPPAAPPPAARASVLPQLRVSGVESRAFESHAFADETDPSVELNSHDLLDEELPPWPEGEGWRLSVWEESASPVADRPKPQVAPLSSVPPQPDVDPKQAALEWEDSAPTTIRPESHRPQASGAPYAQSLSTLRTPSASVWRSDSAKSLAYTAIGAALFGATFGLWHAHSGTGASEVAPETAEASASQTGVSAETTSAVATPRAEVRSRVGARARPPAAAPRNAEASTPAQPSIAVEVDERVRRGSSERNARSRRRARMNSAALSPMLSAAQRRAAAREARRERRRAARQRAQQRRADNAARNRTRRARRAAAAERSEMQAGPSRTRRARTRRASVAMASEHVAMSASPAEVESRTSFRRRPRTRR